MMHPKLTGVTLGITDRNVSNPSRANSLRTGVRSSQCRQIPKPNASTPNTATRGAPAWSEVAKQTSYAPTVAATGELRIDVATIANGYGLELGHTLTAGIENSTGTEALAGVDDTETAASKFLLQRG